MARTDPWVEELQSISRIRVAAIVHVLLFVVALAYLKNARPSVGTWQFGVPAGFFLGTFSTLALRCTDYLQHCWILRRPPFWREPLWVKAFWFLALLICLAAGAIIWYAGWEGRTGAPFGLGMLLASLLGSFAFSEILVRHGDA